jgi:hypothetical protein
MEHKYSDTLREQSARILELPYGEKALVLLVQFEDWSDGNDGGDTAEALYWFAALNHAGQDSTLYGVLSTLPYSPGPISTGPAPDSMAADIFAELELLAREA